MNLSDRDVKFCVYKHTSPNNKVYIGITSKPVTIRWGVDGKEYKSNTYFWNAIQKYGWANFKHEILASNLSLQEASELETSLISKYNSMNPDFGYNHTTGGEWSHPSDEVKARLKDITTNHWRDPEFRDKVVQGLLGHNVSESTRLKISDANKGKPGPNHPWTGKTIPEEHIDKYRGHTPWNKGKTKHDNEIIAKYSDKLSGRHRSESHSKHISESRKQQYENGYTPIWINNGEVETTIDSSKESIPHGYVKGRLPVAYKYMYKGNVCKRVLESFVNDMLAEGWILGRGKSVGVSIRNSKHCYIYIVDNLKFNTSRDAASFLKLHGYPTISSSTVENIAKGTLPSTSKYYDLVDRIIRVEPCNENKEN